MKLQVSFNGLEPSDALKDYIEEKLTKFENLLKGATSIEVVFREHVHTRGVDDDFKVDVNVFLPNATVRAEQSGGDMYAAIDAVSDTLSRRVKRYHDRRRYWEGVTPWRVLEAEEAMDALREESDRPDNYVDYVPKITSRKKMDDMAPMEEGEAIEKMELLGRAQYLFKNKNTGRISMVYINDLGGYTLVEPIEDDL